MTDDATVYVLGMLRTWLLRSGTSAWLVHIASTQRASVLLRRFPFVL